MLYSFNFFSYHYYYNYYYYSLFFFSYLLTYLVAPSGLRAVPFYTNLPPSITTFGLCNQQNTTRHSCLRPKRATRIFQNRNKKTKKKFFALFCPFLPFLGPFGAFFCLQHLFDDCCMYLLRWVSAQGKP